MKHTLVKFLRYVKGSSLIDIVKIENTRIQGCHFPDNMKFPDFSLTFPDQELALPGVRDHLGGSGGMLPQKIFKIRISNLAENEFQTTKFPDFSLTFGILSQIP